MKLSTRLQEIAAFIGSFDSLIDIGSDHGLLPIFLKQNNPASKVGASEAKKEPFSHLEKAVEKANLNIDIYFSDGLKNIPAAEVISICGMGGSLIATIIADSDYLKKNRPRLVVEPQSSFGVVRRALLQMGYKIIAEKYILERHRYPIIEAIPGVSTAYSEEEIAYGQISLRNRDFELLNLLLQRYEQYVKLPNRYDDAQKIKSTVQRYYGVKVFK